MKIGLIGLGKMGANMSKRLLQGGHKVVGFDRDQQAVKGIVKDGNEGASSIDELISKLPAPKVVWIMVPAGKPVDDTIDLLIPKMKNGEILIDGGNSYYKDSMRRAKKLAEHGISMIDAGVSGGIWGLKEGYSMMVGGDKKAVDQVRPIFGRVSGEKTKWTPMNLEQTNRRLECQLFLRSIIFLTMSASSNAVNGF